MAAANRREFFRTLTVSGLACFSYQAGLPELVADDAKMGFTPQERERIVFLGDSITQGGNYVAYFETLLRLRFPKKSIEIHNHGISSETISGTSEPDHDPRRPWAHERFTRDVADWRPTVVFSCFGMNDGNYHPFDQDRFEKYQAGINRLIERTEKEAGTKRLYISTPPPFDAYQRNNGDKNALHYGYKYPAINYDETLGHYADWLLTLGKQRQNVIDLHGPLNRHLTERRKRRVSFTLMPDAVHPNSTGHAVMAIAMAKALGLNISRDELVIDGTQNRPATAKHGRAELKSGDAQKLVVDWHVPPAWAFGSDVEADSLALEGLDLQFNRLLLKVASLEPGKYQAELQGGERAGMKQVYTAEELSKGINIAPMLPANSPDRVSGLALAAAVMKHRQESSAAWRNRAMKLPRNDEKRGPQLEELAREAEAAARLSGQAGTLAGPIRITISRLQG